MRWTPGAGDNIIQAGRWAVTACRPVAGCSGPLNGEGMAAPLLEVKDLKTQFFTQDGVVNAVNGVSFDLYEEETLGIVGESGSGKSVTALSIMRLIPQPPGKIVSGEVLFKGENLVDASE